MDVVVGKVFGEKSEVFSFFEEYFQQTYQPFVRQITSDAQIVFRCAHWRRRKSISSGKRPNQHYLFTGCNAHINLYKGKENNWKVTLVELGHNHAIGKEEYSMYRRRNKLTYQDYKLITNLIQEKVKDSVVADVIKTKRAKFLTARDVTNIRTKLLQKNSLLKENNETDLDVRLDSESVKDTTSRSTSAELNKDSLNKVKILPKSEKYKIAWEFFSKRVKLLCELNTKEFFKQMEKMENCKECSLEKLCTIACEPGPSFKQKHKEIHFSSQ